MTGRILVVGAGAIGGVAAAYLTRAGYDVTAVDADAEHVALLRQPGLTLEEVHGGTAVIPIQAVTAAAQLTGRFDFALITVKSTAIQAALTPLVADDMVDTYVSLGNGLVQDAVSSVVGRERLLVGLIEWGSTNLGPGHLQQTTDAPIVIGEPDGTSTPRLGQLCGLLSTVAGGSKVSSAIGGQVWTKLLLNSTFSGLGAAAGCLYQDVADHPVGREIALRLWSEGYRTAQALGMELGDVFGVAAKELVLDQSPDRASVDAALDRLMARAGATKASMLQDLGRGRKTEVDVINGGIVTAARTVDRGAPMNAAVTHLIHEHERGATKPGPDAFARLQEVNSS